MVDFGASRGTWSGVGLFGSWPRETFIRKILAHHRAYNLKILEYIVFRSTNPPGGWGGTLRICGYKVILRKCCGYKQKGEILKDLGAVGA